MAIWADGREDIYLAARQLSAPPANSFIRSAHQKAVVVGDYLYIDGGEISQGPNQVLADTQGSRSINDTLSIPLSESWTNDTVQIRALDKGGAPSLKDQALWLDANTSSFYMWGGDTSWSAPPPEDDLWQFSADGSGGGSWVKQAPASPSSFSKLLRVTWGASTASNDAGFYLGGQLGPGTDSAIPEGGPWSVSGIVSFNITTGVWANSTSAPLGGTGRNVGGALQFIPSFGPNGLLLFMGGRFASSSALLSFVHFDVINMYDPVAKSWYAQDATGEMPSPRVNSCTVGVQGPNKTYEIFLYGGNDEKVAYGDVYVLSVPGFFWSKANHTQSSGRWSHTCAVAGKRQMISVGGLNQSLETNTWYAGVDQITRGIGVFDLTALEWSDKYDANADGYQSPDIVKNWYASGKQSTVQWASDEVRALFNHSTGSQGAKPSSTPAAPTPAAPAPTGSHHTNSGAIAGGIVGGVILLLCIGALIWLLQRQRRRKHSSLDQPPKSTAPVLASKPEMESWERNMLDGVPRSELDAVDRRRLGPYELQHSPSARRS